MTRLVKAISHRVRLLLFLLLVAATGCEFGQYNIGNGAGRRGDLDVIWMIGAGWDPIMFTLQEVCQRRYNEMATYLDSHGYRGHFHATDTSACGESGPGFGNAIFFLGERVGQPYIYHYQAQGAHHRAAMALTIQLGSLRYMAWVTHLEANNCPVASAQANELFNQVVFWQAYSNLPFVLGGDFNLTPGESCGGQPPAMNQWRYAFRDAGEGLGSTHENGRKIDYLFSSFGWTAGRVERGVQSDHHLLLGFRQ